MSVPVVEQASGHRLIAIALMSPMYSRLEISGIASQFAIQNARFAIHNKLMHSKIANHLKKTISADI